MLPHLPALPQAWIVAGGGAHNRTLMEMLGERLAPATVETADEAAGRRMRLGAGLRLSAVRTLNNLPITSNDNRCPFVAPGGDIARRLGSLGTAFFFRKAAQNAVSSMR